MLRRIFFVILGSLLFTGCMYSIDETLHQDTKDAEEIVFWYGINGYPSQLMNELIDEFNKSQDDYYIIGIEQSSHEETFSAVKSSIARQKVPSVVLLENQQINYLASKGVVLPLDSYVEDKTTYFDDFIDAYVEQNIVQDEVFGLPFYGTTQVIYYRRDFFEQNNIKPVDLLTWEAFFDVANSLSKKNGEEILVYGWEFMYGTENLIDVAINNGGEFLSEDGKEVLIDSVEWIGAWDYFRRMIHEEKVMYIHYGGEEWNHWYSTLDDVTQGRAAGYIGSCGDMGDLDTGMIGTYLLPSWENKNNNPKGVVNIQSLAIPYGVEESEIEGALAWMDFLTSVDVGVSWSTKTGYLPVRKSSMDQEVFYDKVISNPDYFVPIRQVKMGTFTFIDPTDGVIYSALENAAYQVLIENIPAETALEEAKKKAQFALDELYNQGR